MRIILSYATEFDHHEGHQIARALRQLGHDMQVVNTTVEHATAYWPAARTYPPDVEWAGMSVGTDADLLLYIEPRGLLPRGIERAACHTACILCDTMLALEPRIAISQLFDDVLLFHPHALDLLPRDRTRVHWTPLAIDPELFHERGHARDLDVAFFGSTESIWAPRRPLLERIAARYRTNAFFAARVPFDEIPATYSRARIVVHIPITDALNPRVFEAMGCGALLLTRRVHDRIGDLFTEGVHFVAYTSDDDAIDKIDYYLTHDEERARIAAAGYAEVHRAHTYRERFRRVLECLATLPARTAPARTMSARAVEDIYQLRHKQAGQAGALLRRGLAAPAYSAARYRALVRAGTTYLRHRNRD